MRIHIAIGLTPDNDYTALYLGDSGDEAIAAIQAAGKKKQIVKGIWFRNPQQLPHKAFRFPENVKGAAAREAYSHEVEPKKPAAKKAAKKQSDEPQDDADVFK